MESTIAVSEFKPVFSGGITVNLDWLQVFGRFVTDQMPGFSADCRVWQFSEAFALLARPTGTPMYEFAADVVAYGENVGVMQFCPRLRTGRMKSNTCTFQMANNILYRSDWMDILAELTNDANIEWNNVTRLDIAVDGANHIPGFLNRYARQSNANRCVYIKGDSRFNCLNLKRATGSFQQFQIGSSKSGKQVSVYEKMQELEVSNKKYIKDFWARAGMDTTGPVWRTELRLKGEAIAQMPDFDMAGLTEPEYLASLFKTQTANFFEFVYYPWKDNRVYRGEPIELFDYTIFKSPKLRKATMKKVNDRYKAKLFIHLASKELLLGQIAENLINEHLAVMAEKIHKYDLLEWFKKRREYWIADYGRFGRMSDKLRITEYKF